MPRERETALSPGQYFELKIPKGKKILITIDWRVNAKMNECIAIQQQKGAAVRTFMTMTSGILQRKCACGNHTVAGGECESCRQKREGTLQRAPLSRSEAHGGGGGGVPPIVHEVLRSPGQPLDASTRAFMGPRFGHDFSGVRVHTNAQAEESARAVNALAYTVGRDVVFGAGQYAPQTNTGQRLMAHELTHVVQQGRGIQTFRIGQPGDVYEREADRAADVVSRGNQAAVGSGGVVPILQRQTDPPTTKPAAPNLFPTSLPEETEEERLNRELAEAAREEEARRGVTRPGAPPPTPTKPTSELSLAEAIREMLKKCEAEARRPGEQSRRDLIPPAPPMESKSSSEDTKAELERRIEACLATPEGERVQAMAKDLLLSREGAPITVTLLAGYLAYVLQSGKLPYIPSIKLGKEMELSVSIDGQVTKPDKAMLTLKFTGVPAWLNKVGRALWGATKAVGGAIWSGLKAIGSGIWSALKFIGGGLAAAGRAIWGGAKAVGRGIAGVAGAVWEAVKAAAHAIGVAAETLWEWIQAAGRAIGMAAEATWHAIVAAARWLGQTTVAVLTAILDIARAIGKTLWEFLGCLFQGGRGLLRRLMGGPYQFCHFPTKEQKYLFPVGAVIGFLIGEFSGAVIGALAAWSTILLYHCFRELPWVKKRLGWSDVPAKPGRASGKQCMVGQLVREPCIAADDGDLNLHVRPCAGYEDLVEPGNCASTEDGHVIVECELPYMLFEEQFRLRPSKGDFVKICGQWVHDLGHGKKSELHPFDTLESASPMPFPATIPDCEKK